MNIIEEIAFTAMRGEELTECCSVRLVVSFFNIDTANKKPSSGEDSPFAWLPEQVKR